MKTLRNLHSVVTACGNVLRGAVEVNGREYTVESDGEKWVQIIAVADCRSGTFNMVSNEYQDGVRKEFEFSDGEYVTEDWTDADWTQFTAFVFWTDKLAVPTKEANQ